MSSYGDFVRGRFEGISLSRDGRLSLAPKLDPIFTSDQPVIWSVAQASDGTLYAATGHRGRVYRIDKAGNATLLWTAGQPEVFAIAVDRSGRGLRRHVARWQSLPHREREGLGVLRARSPLHLVPGGGSRWRVIRGHGRPRAGVSRFGRRQGRDLLRYRAGAHHRPRRGLAGAPAGGHRAERNPLPHFGQGQGLRALRFRSARDPGHRAHAGWHRVCRRVGRLHRPADTGRRPVRPRRGRSRGARPPWPPPSPWRPRAKAPARR